MLTPTAAATATSAINTFNKLVLVHLFPRNAADAGISVVRVLGLNAPQTTQFLVSLLKRSDGSERSDGSDKSDGRSVEKGGRVSEYCES